MTTQEDIIERINNRLKMKPNLLEGGFAQQIIGSVSYEIANIIDTEIDMLVDRAFVATAKGEDLDNALADYNVFRNKKTPAKVYLLIKGSAGAVVNNTVQAIYNNLIYTVQEYAVIQDDEGVLVKAICETAGSIGNVEANTINQFVTNYTGLTSVTNPNNAFDGVDEETDEQYRRRGQDYIATSPANGNKAQYKFWALEVSGVANAVVLGAEDVGAGNVGVYISSVTGTVSEELKNTVKNHIKEVQPINANVIVSALTPVSINVTATIRYETTTSISEITSEFKLKLKEYLQTVTDLVSYFGVTDVLYHCSGVIDISNLTINGSSSSIQLTNIQVAEVGNVIINE